METTSSVRVAGAVLCAYRAASVEAGAWSELRRDIAQRLETEPERLDDVRADEWLDLRSLSALLEAELATIDADVLKTRVRRHLTHDESGHVYAPMLRSWTRSFAAPEHMLRAVGPLFRAGLRNVEVPLVCAVHASEAHVLVRGSLLAPLRESEGLCAAFEGLLLGLLDLARPRPVMPEIELSFTRDELRAICHF